MVLSGKRLAEYRTWHKPNMETLQRTANRGSISTGYDIDNSCKFEDDNDEWLYRTNASGTNRKTWTVSWWFKQNRTSFRKWCSCRALARRWLW